MNRSKAPPFTRQCDCCNALQLDSKEGVDDVTVEAIDTRKKKKEEETENKKDGEKKRSFVEAQLLKKKKGKMGKIEPR